MTNPFKQRIFFRSIINEGGILSTPMIYDGVRTKIIFIEFQI